MTHTIHVLTNTQSEAYIMVLNKRTALETLVNNISHNGYQKKNPQRVRFMLDNQNDMTLEHVAVPVDLGKDINEIRAYRDEVIAQYAADGFLVIDDEYYEMQDSPADKNFGEVLKNVSNAAAWAAYYGKETLMNARKSLTVAEMTAAYPWPPA